MGLRIGYFPLSENLSHPGDRRRIVYWAKRNGHELIVNPLSEVDIIVMSERANFGKIMENFPRTPIILDLVDAYIEKENSVKDIVRGVSKIAIGDLSSKPMGFSAIIKQVCLNSQAIICSSPEQLKTILPYNRNVHVILDSHDEFEFRSYLNYRHNKNSNLLWEGMPFTLDGFREISDHLTDFLEQEDLRLRLITDLNYFKYLGKFGKASANTLITKIFSNNVSRIDLDRWSVTNLEMASKEAILGVLPVNISNPIQYLKPENRVLIMWRLGIPVIASDTPAYSRIMKSSGIAQLPNLAGEWIDSISRLVKDRDYARFTLEQGQKYLNENHNYEKFNSAWNHAIESVR